MRSLDRVLVLKIKDGKLPTSSTGMVDTRLFSRDNNLHAKMNTTNSLWSFAYDEGMLPQPLKQQFTSFSKALKCAREYFEKRNVEITEVID